MKETWNIINQLIEKHSEATNITSIVKDDTCLTKANEIADSITDLLCSIGEKLSLYISSTESPLLIGNYLINENHAHFHLVTIRPEKLSKIANVLKTYSSCGIYVLSSFFVNIGMHVSALSLRCVCNISISHGQFPESCKITRCFPIHKDGST